MRAARGASPSRGCRWHLTASAAALLIASSCTRTHAEPGSGPATRAATRAGPRQPAAEGARLTRTDRLRWRAIAQWPDRCERAFYHSDPEFGGLELFPLGEKQKLLQVCCTLGAYQGTYRFYRIDESTSPPTVTELVFTTYVSSGVPGPRLLEEERSSAVTGTPRFEPSARQLVVLNKYRGPGDCGMLSRYALEGAQPELVAVRAQLDCERSAGESDPTRWRSLPVKAGAIVR